MIRGEGRNKRAGTRGCVESRGGLGRGTLHGMGKHPQLGSGESGEEVEVDGNARDGV